MRIDRLMLTLTTVAAVGLASVPPASARPVQASTRYRCESSYGSGTSAVQIHSALPAAVKRGAKVPARSVTVAMRVPAQMLATMRQYGVRTVSGTASGVKVRVGPVTVPVTDLRVPRTRVPVSGPMTLHAAGTVKPFRIAKAGSYTVRVPASIPAHVVAHTDSFTAQADLSCAVVPGAPTRLGTLRVTR